MTDQEIIQNLPDRDHTILAGFRGSVAHGMYRPPTEPTSIDDIDVMSVVVPNIDYYFGLKQYGSRGTIERRIQSEGAETLLDVVTYEARKFVGLLAQGNPNVLCLLWLDKYLIRRHSGEMLVENRHLFAGRHVYHSFVGYAHGQIRKIVPGAFKGYMGEKRKGLVERFGFDTKNASHCIRLLRMGIEFLQTGELQVNRPDRDYLLAIKDGQVPLEKVLLESQRLFATAKEAYEHSPLPQEPDREKINRLCVGMIQNEMAF